MRTAKLFRSVCHDRQTEPCFWLGRPEREAGDFPAVLPIVPKWRLSQWLWDVCLVISTVTKYPRKVIKK